MRPTCDIYDKMTAHRFTFTSHHLGISYYVNFLGRLGSNGFHLKWRALPIKPIWPSFALNGLDLHSSLAVTSKTAPQEFDLFNCHACQTFISSEIHCYLSALKSWHNNLFPSSVNTGGQYGIITHIGHTISWPRRENEQYKFSSRTAWRVSSASRTTDAQLSLFKLAVSLPDERSF